MSEMTALPPVLIKERMTHEEYMKFCDEDTKADLIDGVLIVQSPASDRHEVLFKFLLQVFDLYVTRRDLGQVRGSRTAVRLASGHTYEPDLLFVARDRAHIIGEDYIDGAPDLVVEILSASTYHYDTGPKRVGYEQAGVRELWLIDPYGSKGTQVLRRDETTGTFLAIEPEGEPEGYIYRSAVIAGLWLRQAWLWSPEEQFPDVLDVLRELGCL
jgi:Uma2 family endonuclease